MKISGDKVWDFTRGVWVKLTPEEHVRQWFVDQLIDTHHVEPVRIATEYCISVGGRRLRIDIAIFAPRAMDILAIVECKAPGVALTESTMRQAAAYNSVVGARYIILTNGAQYMIYNTTNHEFENKLCEQL
ncbi:MAG: type I restriction enzyme HsdR N-terminal domain-containing protein [Mucinivorans sp.]